MAIDLSKILTISARDYCDMHGRSLTDYEAVGIHADGDIGINRGSLLNTLLNSFGKKVPENTEVVVNYQSMIGLVKYIVYGIASGTALIPKERESKPSEYF